MASATWPENIQPRRQLPFRPLLAIRFLFALAKHLIETRVQLKPAANHRKKRIGVAFNRNTLQRSPDAILCRRRRFFGARAMGKSAPAERRAMSRPERPWPTVPGICVNLLYFDLRGTANGRLEKASPVLKDCRLHKYGCMIIINCQWFLRSKVGAPGCGNQTYEVGKAAGPLTCSPLPAL